MDKNLRLTFFAHPVNYARLEDMSPVLCFGAVWLALVSIHPVFVLSVWHMPSSNNRLLSDNFE